MTFIHGHRCTNRSPTYISWIGMKSRMLRGYARGLEGHDPRWLQFESFLLDMGDRPLGHDLGRLDHTRGYSIENCAWQPPRKNRGRQK